MASEAASDVVETFRSENRVRDHAWEKESEALSLNITKQGNLLQNFQAKLDDQDKRWASVQANVSVSASHLEKQRQDQEVELLNLRKEMDELQRQQHLQEAAFRDMEFAYHTLYHDEEKHRLQDFLDDWQNDKINSFLSQLNLSSITAVDVLKNSNGSNIFIFPQVEPVREIETTRYMHINL